MPEYVEDFFLRAYRRIAGQRLTPRPGQNGRFYAIPNVPYDLRQWGENYDFKANYGLLFLITNKSPSTNTWPASKRRLNLSRPAIPCRKRLIRKS